MTRISTLARTASELTTVLVLAALIAISAGCSGDGGSTAAAPPTPASIRSPPGRSRCRNTELGRRSHRHERAVTERSS